MRRGEAEAKREPHCHEHFAGRTTVAVPYFGGHVVNAVDHDCQLVQPGGK